jgi:hypothetical protein
MIGIRNGSLVITSGREGFVQTLGPQGGIPMGICRGENTTYV